MGEATHFNVTLNNHYLLKDGVVFMWFDRWVTSAFKEVDINAENGFKRL